jgi:hypothetical protein
VPPTTAIYFRRTLLEHDGSRSTDGNPCGAWGNKAGIFFQCTSLSSTSDRAIGLPAVWLTLFIPHLANRAQRHFTDLYWVIELVLLSNGSCRFEEPCQSGFGALAQ